MDFNPNNFKEVSYDIYKLYFDKDCSFHKYFNHKQRTKKFPYYKNIFQFLTENPDTKLYFTLNEEIRSFQGVTDGFLVSMSAYQQFCKTIGSKTGGRLKAFLGQNFRLKDTSASEIEKTEFIKANATEKNILEAIKILPKEAQLNIIHSLNIIAPVDYRAPVEFTSIEFIAAFSKFLTDKSVQVAFYSNLPRFQIEILKSHRDFLKNNLDKDETFIQNWIDEDSGKFRKQRCLIFGIEYVDPKSQGEFMRKRFDILAEQNLDNHVLIELKSPSADVFTIKNSTTINDGLMTEYHLSFDLARAIPQILGYKKWYENARSEEIQALGIEKKDIHKCIIIIGTRKEDRVWKENFKELKSHLNLELYTYTDLIDKLENTIRNLENSLKKIIIS